MLKSFIAHNARSLLIFMTLIHMHMYIYMYYGFDHDLSHRHNISITEMYPVHYNHQKFSTFPIGVHKILYINIILPLPFVY
jgi:hypothetical protein